MERSQPNTAAPSREVSVQNLAVHASPTKVSYVMAVHASPKLSKVMVLYSSQSLDIKVCKT